MTAVDAQYPSRCPHCGNLPRTLRVLNAWNAVLIQCPGDACPIYSRPFSPDRWEAYVEHHKGGHGYHE